MNLSVAVMVGEQNLSFATHSDTGISNQPQTVDKTGSLALIIYTSMAQYYTLVRKMPQVVMS